MALDAAPHNFQLKLALVHCYECLGAPRLAYELYKRCDIKQIQHETLSYMVLPALAQLGASAEADAALLSVRRFQAHGLQDVPEQLHLAFQHGNYTQALEFVAFRRSLEHSWWHSLTDVLVALQTLRVNPGGPATLHTALAAAPFLSIDTSADYLETLPDPLDVSPFEEHLPCPPPNRLNALRRTWLPLRIHLLRVLWHALGGAAGAVAQMHAHAESDKSVAAIEELVAASAASAASAAAEAAAEAAEEAAEEVAEEWTSLLAMARLTSLLLAPAADDADAAAAERAAAAILEATRAMGASVLQHCAAPLAALKAAGGYTPAALPLLAHLTQLVLPTLSVLATRWAAMLPGAKKKKNKGGGGAEAEAEQPASARTSALSASSAQPADARSAVKEAVGAIVEAVSTLQLALSSAESTPAACALLAEEPDAWLARVGAGAGSAVAGEAGAARKALLSALEGEGKAHLAGLAASAKEVLAALRAALKLL